MTCFGRNAPSVGAAFVMFGGISLAGSLSGASASPFPSATISTTAAIAASELEGEMAKLNYLLGAWICKDASSEQPLSSTTFTVAPGNTIHEHDTGSDGRRDVDKYLGYIPAKHDYYLTMADSEGAHGSGSSADGITFSETIWFGSVVSYKETLTFHQRSSNVFAFHDENILNGIENSGDAICSRPTEAN
jgi:hypothetical protein